MRTLAIAMMTAGALTLAACGGKGDDALGDNVADAYDNRADAMDAMADNATGATKDALEAEADATRAAGAAKEEAIDDADVNADAMTDAQKNQMAK